MRIFILVVTIFHLYGCDSEIRKENNCTYTISDLFKNYDSTKFEIKRYPEFTEVFDSCGKTPERGFYKFDEKGRLVFYVFLLNKNNDYYFGVNYDSAGNAISKVPTKVARWIVGKYGNDSLKISFLLFKINGKFGDVRLKVSGNYVKARLFESKCFSNLIGDDVVISIPENKIVYLTGHYQNRCNDTAIRQFNDSVFVPEELFAK